MGSLVERLTGTGMAKIWLLAAAGVLLRALLAAGPVWGAPPVTIATAGGGAGQVNDPESVAVDQASGDVYVADANNRRIDMFTLAGKFIRAFGWGVTNGANELQQCTTATGCEPGLNGSGPGEARR